MTKKAHELEFIWRIKRDGSGTIPVTNKNKDFLSNLKYVDEKFTLNSLSMTEKTFIASGFNSYVVKLK